MAATQSRYAKATPGEVVPTTRTTVTGEEQLTQDKTGLSSASGSSFENIDTTNMDAASFAALQELIAQLSAGGTTEQKVANARRDQTRQLVEQLLGQISPNMAFEESKGLMALNLQQALERNMPAIQKAIEGAGTSSSSMQGVLSQQMARDAALAAAALGGQQAAQYAAQRSNLANTLENLTRPTNDITKALMEALQLSKGATSSTRRTGGSSERRTDSSSMQQRTAPMTTTELLSSSDQSGESSLGSVRPYSTPTPTYRDLVARSGSPSFSEYLLRL